MHNTPEDHAHYLYDLVSNAHEEPTDDYDHHQWIKPLELPTGSQAAATFNQSVVEKCDALEGIYLKNGAVEITGVWILNYEHARLLLFCADQLKIVFWVLVELEVLVAHHLVHLISERLAVQGSEGRLGLPSLNGY